MVNSLVAAAADRANAPVSSPPARAPGIPDFVALRKPLPTAAPASAAGGSGGGGEGGGGGGGGGGSGGGGSGGGGGGAGDGCVGDGGAGGGGGEVAVADLADLEGLLPEAELKAAQGDALLQQFARVPAVSYLAHCFSTARQYA